MIKPNIPMSTPQQAPKAPRRSARKPKQDDTLSAPLLRGTASDNEISQTQTQLKDLQTNGDVPASRRRSQASIKKANGGAYRGSVSDNIQPEKPKATPVKQAYAGPTFHQSPAASALPIPSFYSKSVPSVSAFEAPPQVVSQQLHEQQAWDGAKDTPNKRESTPLDFLFDAARQAQRTPRGESPIARAGHALVPPGSPSKSPAPKHQDSMFPFELDGSSTPGEGGSPFATPYKERIEAMRVSRPASEGAQSLDENERRAKTEALKKLLMKNAGSQDPEAPNLNNPFNARAPQSPNQLAMPQSQPRHRSGPSTPSYMQSYQGNGRSDQYFPHMPHYPNNDPSQYPPYRPSSNLRNVYGTPREPEPTELSSDSAISPPRISVVRKPSYPISPPAGAPERIFTAHNASQAPCHRAKPSVQQMEDDLRRVLKLDLTGRV